MIFACDWNNGINIVCMIFSIQTHLSLSLRIVSPILAIWILFSFVSHCLATFSRKMKARDGIAATWKIESEKLRPNAEPKSSRRKKQMKCDEIALVFHIFISWLTFSLWPVCARAFISNFVRFLSKNSISQKHTSAQRRCGRNNREPLQQIAKWFNFMQNQKRIWRRLSLLQVPRVATVQSECTKSRSKRISERQKKHEKQKNYDDMVWWWRIRDYLIDFIVRH